MSVETILIGIVVAVFYVEILEIYPGGIIVPAYVAHHLDQPPAIVVTVLIAVSSLITYRILARFLILFGKRRFVTLVLLGVFYSQLWLVLGPGLFAEPGNLQAVGWLIPGLLANNLEKQRFIPTLASMFTVAIMTYFLARMLAWL